jgi:NTP pyrophosphatase (non-canonical NTP hydrolase)
MTITAGSMGGRSNYDPYGLHGKATRDKSLDKPTTTVNEGAPQRAAKSLEELDKGLTFLQYQLAAETTAVYPGKGTANLEALSYLFTLLAGEAGEAAGKFGKIIRDRIGKGVPGTLEDREAILYELGDVLWAVAMICDELDASMEDVANMNVEKLRSRQERDVLHGSGDTR